MTDHIKNKYKIILASGSPRRRELLAMLGVPFDVKVSRTEETAAGPDPASVTEELSRQKAVAVAKEVTAGTEEACIVIGADTVVSADGQILGKPADREEARRMISLLQGRSHTVYTGVTLVACKGKEREITTFSEGTEVHVAPMSEDEIDAYTDTPEPYDKAGAYGIQGIFARHIRGIEGDYFNVVGLPLHRLYQELAKL